MNRSMAIGQTGIAALPMVTAIVFLLALALVAFRLATSFNTTVMDSLDEVDMEAMQALSATEAIVVAQGANAELVATLAQVAQIHQSALLSRDRAAAAEVRAARARLTMASATLAASLSGLGEVREALESDADTAQPEARRLLGFAERGAVAVPRIVALFVEANNRTLERLEMGEADAARANFLFEERARLEAVTDRVRRQVDVLERLARQVSAIEAEHVHRIIAAASERATARSWIGIVAAASIAAVAIGLAILMFRRGRAARSPL